MMLGYFNAICNQWYDGVINNKWFIFAEMWLILLCFVKKLENMTIVAFCEEK